jgi:hypothetical protein
MSADYKNLAASAAKKTCCALWTFTVNLGRRAKILGRYTLACWQQQKIRCALGRLGAKTFAALEQGEANPLMAPEVNEAVQKVKALKDAKDLNYQAIAAIRERIRTSCAVPAPAAPEEPAAAEEKPPEA